MSAPVFFRAARAWLSRGVLFFWVVPTLRCNLMCKTCGAASVSTPDLDPATLERALNGSRTLQDALFVLEGGEVFLHPDFDGLLRTLSRRRLVLFTNGTFPGRLEELCRRRPLERVFVSLDAGPEKNRALRGADFSLVIDSVRRTRSLAPVSLNCTVSPFNTRGDVAEVRRIAAAEGVDFELNLYHPLQYLGASAPALDVPRAAEETADAFAAAYAGWKSGTLSLPCLNVEIISGLYPDGSVRLCKCRPGDVLGNIAGETFDEIWRSSRAQDLRAAARGCNGCWLKCQRFVDYRLFRLLRRVLPARAAAALMQRL